VLPCRGGLSSPLPGGGWHLSGRPRASAARCVYGHACARPPGARRERAGTQRGPIRLTRGRVNRSDPFQQHLVGDRTGRWRAPAPSVVARFRHAEPACHRGDRKVSLVRAHECEDPGGTAPVSRANQAAARERMSRSRRNCLFSRRNRISSSRSEGVTTALSSFGRPSCRSATATQWRIECEVGSNSHASSSGSRPARTSSTICRRNSGE
jgi:hypothetical protein